MEIESEGGDATAILDNVEQRRGKSLDRVVSKTLSERKAICARLREEQCAEWITIDERMGDKAED